MSPVSNFLSICPLTLLIGHKSTAVFPVFGMELSSVLKFPSFFATVLNNICPYSKKKKKKKLFYTPVFFILLIVTVSRHFPYNLEKQLFLPKYFKKLLSSLDLETSFSHRGSSWPETKTQSSTFPRWAGASLSQVLTGLATPGPGWKWPQLPESRGSSTSKCLLMAPIKLVFLRVNFTFHKPCEVLCQQIFLWSTMCEGVFIGPPACPQFSESDNYI